MLVNWNSKDLVFWNGEIGFLLDFGQVVKLKVGDGIKKWSEFDFFVFDGKLVQLWVVDGYIQWNYVGDMFWINLVFLDNLCGVDGDDGVDGKSVYEIVVDGGFVGMILDWLVLLKGEFGDKGDKGDFGNFGMLYVCCIQYVVDIDVGIFECDWGQYDEIWIFFMVMVVLSFIGVIDGQGCVLKLCQLLVGGCQVGLFFGVVWFNFLIQVYVVIQIGLCVDKVGFVYDGEDV